MIKVLSGDMDVSSVDQWMMEQGIREEDEVKVCELFDQYERRGRAEGEKIGRAQGERVGRAEGERVGRAQGKKIGRAEGEAKLAKLLQILLDGGRNDDLKKAVADQHYREQLYVEVGLA